MFGADGAPLGELITEPTGGGVVWEPAPGRPLRADAAPGEGLTTAQRPLGLLASGMVAADAAARAGQPAGAAGGPAESALSAFLRAIDTTLWTVDPIAGAGSSAVASIVGRPVAVVRTVLSVDVADDLDALTLDDAGRAARAQAYADLTRLGVPVRIGELTRTDDGVLGWFADDDYSRMHVVDKLVRDEALAAGPGQGHFGPWGTTPVVPDPQPIDHPYLDTADTVVVHPGSPRLLTVLMLPGSTASVTCGLVPRVTIALQRAWYAPGLEKLSPSVRVGPVLVDPGQVRLPAVTALGQRQVLTHREGPLGWQDDAILAATQDGAAAGPGVRAARGLDPGRPVSPAAARHRLGDRVHVGGGSVMTRYEWPPAPRAPAGPVPGPPGRHRRAGRGQRPGRPAVRAGPAPVRPGRGAAGGSRPARPAPGPRPAARPLHGPVAADGAGHHPARTDRRRSPGQRADPGPGGQRRRHQDLRGRGGRRGLVLRRQR